MNHPADPFVASFVGVETILTGKVAKKNGGTFVASVSGKEIEAVGEVRIGETVILCIRPENVTLSTHPLREATSARNLFVGRILKIAPMGPYQKIHLDCGFPLVAYVTRHSIDELSLVEGKEVSASFKATGVTAIRK
jgi:tungstate transport system ATP-binding protein